MNIIDDIIKELQEENLIDNYDQNLSERVRKLLNTRLTGFDIAPTVSEEPSEITKFVAESLSRKSDIRYSIAGVRPSAVLPQPRMRVVKKNVKFSRPCKCCNANVFWLDAFCINCNERMIGNFTYYSFFMLCAGMIGFMVFYMAISNPY